ncbi:MAG: hypothetical protein AAGG01_00100 [Planctomycetota bacterium]
MKDSLWFTGSVLRAALGRVQSWWLLSFQLLGLLAVLSVFFGGRVLGVESTWPASMTLALSGWVPAAVAVLIAIGLGRLAALPAIAMLPHFGALGRFAAHGSAIALIVIAAGTSAWSGTLTPALAAALALVAYTLGLLVVVTTPARRSWLLGIYVLFHVSLLKGGLEPYLRPLSRSLLLGGAAAAALFVALQIMWPRRSVAVQNTHGAGNTGFPGPRAVSRPASALQRFREADRFRRATRSSGPRWRALANLTLILLGPLLAVVLMNAVGNFGDSSLSFQQRLYGDVVLNVNPDDASQARWSDASLYLVPALILGAIFAIAQHHVFSPVLLNRGTMARMAVRGYLSDFGQLVAIVTLVTIAVVGLVASLTGIGWPKTPPPIFLGLAAMVGLSPWLTLLTLWFQRDGSAAGRGSHSASIFQSHRGFLIAFGVGLPAYMIGIRYLLQKAFPEASIRAVMAVSLMAALIGVMLLPAAFRRYYGRVSLEP